MKEEEKREEYEVEILSREIITTYPKLRQPALTSLVTYVAAGLPPESISILLTDVEPEKPEALAEQIRAGKGPLWGRYLEEERKRVRKRIEERLAAKPEVYRV